MTEARTIRVGIVQMKMSPQRGENLQKAVEKVGEASRQGAQIVCLPELFLSPYFCQEESDKYFDLAEPIPSETTEVLAGLAKDKEVVLVAPLFEKRATGLYHNSLLIFDRDGKQLDHYRKMHIPDDPKFYEKYYFTPGDLGFRAVQTSVAKVGALICWDQWFPEGARLTALQGAEILFYPTAIGWHPSEKDQFGVQQHEAWKTIQRSHAIANGVFVVSVNRTGHERIAADDDGIEFWGQSFLCGPQGQVLAEAPVSEEAVLVVEIDLNQAEETRRNWPFLRDRRIDAYEGLGKRYLD